MVSISIGMMMVGECDLMNFGTGGRRAESSPESSDHLRKPVIMRHTVSLAMNGLDKCKFRPKPTESLQ